MRVLVAFIFSFSWSFGAHGFSFSRPFSTRRGSVALAGTETATVQIGKVKNVALLQSTNPLQIITHIASLASSVPIKVSEVESESTVSHEESSKYANKVDALLTKGWHHTSDMESYVIPEKEETLMDTAGARPSTYGEITPRGARQLFSEMGLLGDASAMNDDQVVFLDFGSGLGKLVAQAYMEVPNLVESMGIEMSQTRHEAALKAWSSIQAEAQATRSDDDGSSCTIKLEQGDMFQVDVSRVTHIYISSPCFSPAMMERLALKLATEATELQCVATVRPFPEETEIFLGRPGIGYVEQSWTAPDVEDVYLYFPG